MWYSSKSLSYSYSCYFHSPVILYDIMFYLPVTASHDYPSLSSSYYYYHEYVSSSSFAPTRAPSEAARVRYRATTRGRPPPFAGEGVGGSTHGAMTTLSPWNPSSRRPRGTCSSPPPARREATGPGGARPQHGAAAAAPHTPPPHAPQLLPERRSAARNCACAPKPSMCFP